MDKANGTALVHEPGKVPGVKFQFGEKDYIIPALNLRSVRMHEAEIRKAASEDPSAQLGVIAKIALAALRRNYPDLTEDFVEEWVDMRNKDEVLAAIMGQSGFVRIAPGEATAALSTGQASTAA